MTDPLRVAIHAVLSTSALERVRGTSSAVHVVAGLEDGRASDEWARAEVLFTQRLSQDRLREAASLRWIQTLGAGVDWLLSPEIVQRDLIVTNASGIHADPIAEHVFGLLLAFARRLDRAIIQQQRGTWNSATLRGSTRGLRGATLGVLGVGAIGERVAALGKAFGMRVVGLRRSGRPLPDVDRMLDASALPELLGEAHYLVNALPLTPATRGLLDARAFRLMRSDAVLVNIGRGATVVTDALVDALRSGAIAGAAIDVTDPEPLPAGHPLWNLENVIITPHFSGFRADYIDRATDVFVENLRRYLAGEALVNVVDQEAGY